MRKRLLAVAFVVTLAGGVVLGTAGAALAWGANITIDCFKVVVQFVNLVEPHHDEGDAQINIVVNPGSGSTAASFHFSPSNDKFTHEINPIGEAEVTVIVHGDDGHGGVHDFKKTEPVSCASPSPSPTPTPSETTPPPTTPPPTTPPPTTSPTPTPTETTPPPPTETSPPPTTTSPPPPQTETPSEEPSLAFTGPNDPLGIPTWGWIAFIAILILVGITAYLRGWYLDKDPDDGM